MFPLSTKNFNSKWDITENTYKVAIVQRARLGHVSRKSTAKQNSRDTRVELEHFSPVCKPEQELSSLSVAHVHVHKH